MVFADRAVEERATFVQRPCTDDIARPGGRAGYADILWSGLWEGSELLRIRNSHKQRLFVFGTVPNSLMGAADP